ncbi:uncharacterized protein V1518DRAFT_406981 [Limtongia smithiae]|uniref:uncharacterized protein n=1 Tax=Limtongia smithiae TaxID=1125753 RepID=UPI0034CEF906
MEMEYTAPPGGYDQGYEERRSASPIHTDERPQMDEYRDQAAPSGPESLNKGDNLFVTGVHPRVSEEQLLELFSKYGEVEKCEIMKDPHSAESRGFGFVKFHESKHADAAREALQGFDFEGRTLSLTIALPHPAALKLHAAVALARPPREDTTVLAGGFLFDFDILTTSGVSAGFSTADTRFPSRRGPPPRGYEDRYAPRRDDDDRRRYSDRYDDRDRDRDRDRYGGSSGGGAYERDRYRDERPPYRERESYRDRDRYDDRERDRDYPPRGGDDYRGGRYDRR